MSERPETIAAYRGISVMDCWTGCVGDADPVACFQGCEGM